MKYLITLITLITFINSLNFCEEKTSSIFQFRIVGGTNMKSGMNWMAKLISFGDNNEGILCGATIIDDHWLLTAAHCALQLKKRSYVTVRQEKTEKELTIGVRLAYIHPKYNNYTADNDIALLRVDTSLTNKGFTPVCLVKKDTKLIDEYPNGLVVGYGLSLDSVENGKSVLVANTNQLQQTTVPIIPAAKCSMTWRILSFRSVDISPNQVCAGSYMHGTAPGDSGGPLLIKKVDGTYIQIGVTSFGADGLEGLIDQGQYPGVYTRVSKYVPWIETIVKQSSNLNLINFTFSFLFLSITIQFLYS